MTKKELQRLEDIWDTYSDMVECHMRKEKPEEWSKMLTMGTQLERILNEHSNKTNSTYSKKYLIDSIKKDIENEKR